MFAFYGDIGEQPRAATAPLVARVGYRAARRNAAHRLAGRRPLRGARPAGRERARPTSAT